MSKPPARIDDEIKVDKHGGGKIASSQATVTFEGKEVACAGDKVKHKDGTETTLKAGNSCVLVNGKPVALLGDETEADGKVSSAASTIKIDEGKPFVFISGSNVRIGKNVSFKVKEPEKNPTLEAIKDIAEILASGGLFIGAIAGDETGVGEVVQVKTAEEIVTDYEELQNILKTATKGKQRSTLQYDRAGGFDQATADFDRIAGNNSIKVHINGVRSTTLSNGTKISVRNFSSEGRPTLQINPENGPKIKVRYAK